MPERLAVAERLRIKAVVPLRCTTAFQDAGAQPSNPRPFSAVFPFVLGVDQKGTNC